MKFQHRNLWIITVVFCAIFCSFFLICCKKKIYKNNISSSELNLVKKKLNISILRYDNDIFSLDLNNLSKEVERLSKIYPQFLIEPEIWNDQEQLDRLKAYLQDTVIIAIHKATEKTVKTDIILKELENGFGYYKIFYPNDSIPVIITLLPGLVFTQPSVYFYDDFNFLCVNIDMYLGADNPFYKAAGLQAYIAERCEPIYLPVDIFKKAMVYKHLEKEPRTTLIENMIFEGKKLFFTEMMFPNLQERYIIGYSEEKLNWAYKYLGNVWSYMIEKNELFGKEEALQRSYIEEAPFTKHFGSESPGRLGIFIGWKLVQSFMKNNPEITLPELMQESDYQKILNYSKFKPQVK
ncbi:MAG: DUF2268 domain-containing putative Zn-dependent protease [Bacteroidales bacterium]|jgi:hypothetical protein|nr:DUF2268 domain-containing putative Zn-dependent protease [Bacteroidales bacterium]